MATESRVRIEGMEHCLKQFRRMPHVAKKYIGEAIKVTEITLAQKVRNAASADTGALRHAISSKTTGLTANITIEDGDIYGRRPFVYWRFVEFGSVHNSPARPFIRPASEAEQNPMIGRIKNAGVRMERDLDA